MAKVFRRCRLRFPPLAPLRSKAGLGGNAALAPAFAWPVLVPRQISFVTSCRARVGRVTPCAPRSADSFPNGAHGVTRPATSGNLFVTVLAARGDFLQHLDT